MYIDIYGQKWYKGNFHTHTNRSDGKITFEDTVSRYRNMGYDFLSISDHWVTSETVSEDNFLLLSGCEYDTEYFESHGNIKRKVVMHISGIGFTSVPKLEKGPYLRGQEIIDEIRAAGGVAIFNHPEWSRNLPSDIAQLRNLAGVEIFNSNCGWWIYHYDYSGFHIDQLALIGQNLRVFAGDDIHSFTPVCGKSFTMVQADSLSRESIMDAINKGRFYASQGPQIYTELEWKTLKVTCTPVMKILVYTGNCGGYSRKSNVPITGAEFKLSDLDYYYRVEVIDKDGNMAWTSPEAIEAPMESERERQLKIELRNKIGHVEQLMESENLLKGELQSKAGYIDQLILSEKKLNAEINSMVNSRSWKVASRLSALSRKIFPPYSKRRFFAKNILNFFRHPFRPISKKP